MKRTMLFILLLALALGAITNLGAQVEVTIGDGTTTNTSTGAPSPYGTWYKSFRQQLLYKANELFTAGATPGLITALGFNVQDLDTCTPMTNFTIRLKHTDQEALSTTFEVGDYTTVWQSDPFMPTTGWNLHTLTTPFLWDGTSNLLVEIVTDLVTGAYAHNALTYYTPTAYISSVRYQSDSLNANTSLTGTTLMNRTNIRFVMSPLSTDPLFLVGPPAKNFGDVVLGYTPSQTFRVMNGGGGTLTVNSISLSGNASFSLTDLPTLPAQLILGEPISFNVVYAPTAAGDHTATITITDNLRQTHTVVLSGTGVDTTIYELSHNEGFDTVAIPALPLGWNSIYQATVGTGYVKTVTTTPQSTPNCVAIYNPTDINTIAMLIAPPLANTIPVNNVRVKLWGKGTNYSLKVGVMTNPSDPTTFTEIQTLTFTAAWEQYQVSLGSYTGNGKFIAFKHANNALAQTIYLDTVEFEMMGANDLAALALSGNSSPSINTPTQYTVNVFNNGTASQSNYNVKLYNGNNVELATVAGTTVAAGTSVDVVLSWTPSTQGAMSIYAKVILAGDINPGNDTTAPLNIFVIAADLLSAEIGNGTATNTTTGSPAPYGTYMKNFRQQYLVLASELNDEGGGPGNIYSVGFNVQALNNCSPMPNYRIRIKPTTQTVLTTTFEVGNYTQVFQANEFMPVEGWNTHGFSTPYVWDGAANLLIDIVTDLIPGTYTQNASSPYTVTALNSSLRYQSDSAVALDSATGTVSVNRANMKFIMEALDMVDMKAVSITGPTTPNVNSTVNYVVSVKNYSPTAQSNYTVKLMKGNGVEIASATGTTISPQQTLTFTLPWTPAAVGENQLYGKVIMAGDENPDNDETSRLAVFVMEAGLLVAEIGTGTATNTNTGAPAPYGTWYRAFRQQLLYRADDFFAAGAAPGLISALAFNVQNLDTCSPMLNFTIRLKQTDQEALTTTFEVGDYTTVLQSDEFMPTTDWNLHNLATPFLWDGASNLLVDITTDMMVGTLGRNALVYFSPTTYNSSLRFQSDSANGSTGVTGTVALNRSNVRFYMSALSADPLFLVSPPAKDFGDVVLGYTPSQTFRVINGGGGTLTVNSISISGNAFFALTDLPTLPAQLTLGQTLPFDVVYTPTTAGDHTATITITDNLRQTHTVVLSGTGVDTTIYELSHSEGFDTVSIPNLPMGWNSIYQATATTGYVKTLTTSPQSAPNCVAIYNPTDINTIAMLIAPPLANTIPVNNVRVKLWGKGTNYSLKVGVMTNPADPATFTEIETLTFVAAWAPYEVSLASYTGTGKFIAFKHACNAAGQTIYVDTVEFEMMGADDLAAISIVGNTTPSVNAATNYTVSVYNNGTAAQSNYQVQIVNDQGTVLANAAGQNIAPGATVNTVLSYTPTTQGTQVILGKVVLAGDINPGNNTSPPLNILVQSADILSVTIGTGNLTEGIPWEFYYKTSLFQTLYYPDEFGVFGQITGISFYNNFVTNLSNTPIKLWLGTTTLTDLSAGWADPTAMTLVYDGTMNFPSGQNTITIPLITPFNYFSDNLVLYAMRPLDASYYSSTDDFKAQTVGTNRARKLQNDSVVYDPMAPSAAGTLSGTFPMTTFFMNVDGMGSLSGTVTAAGSPLADVDISVVNNSYHTTTSASGQYSFSHIQEGDYTLLAHKIGYEDHTATFSIVEDQVTTVNIAMTASASVNVTGSIVGSDNPSVGLSDGVINLYGVINYTANTNAAGQFVVENVLSGNTYNYTISRAGYQNATGTIIVGSTSYAMGTINLLELTLPPSAITATVNTAETAVNLVWGAPGTPGNFHFFDFEDDNGGWVASSNWTGTGLPNYPNGDWQWNNTYNVANYNTAGGDTPQVPPQAAHSGTGMVGTNIYGPYANCAISGERSFLRQSFDLSNFDSPVLSFWHHMDGYNTWDYGQIMVNGNVVWGTSALAVFMPWQELTVDLSAYASLTEAEISFEWVSTTVVNYAGWYIDDIYIGPADRALYASAPANIVSGDFRFTSKPESAQLAEESASQQDSRRASQGPARQMASSLSQPLHNPSRLPLGYKVWRLEYGQENTPALWTSLTPAMITDTTFTDPAWASFPDGMYKWAVKTIYTNNVESNAGFSNNVRKQPNDMSALTISGNSTPSVGSPSEYTVRIKNTGTSAKAAGSYTVKIMSGTTELVSVAGPAIAVNQTIDLAINWNPTQQGPIQVFGKVVLVGDSEPTNDQTPPITLLVMPAGQFAYTVGDGSQLANIPVYMYYKSSLFQMMLYPAELSNFTGFINGIQFYNNFVTNLPDKPTKIWFETTTLENLADGWVPITTSSTLVFDSNVTYPMGENTVTIPFAEPFMYLNGQNLLITVQRPLDGAYFSSSDKFKSQTIGTNRARETHSDTIEYDPTAPPTAGVLSGQFPMTTLLGIPGGVGHLNGTVTTGTGNTPLEGVLVQFTDAGYQATTNTAGEYEIRYIIPGTYNLAFSSYGYITHTQVLVLAEDEQAVINVNMQPMPKVAVSGTIVASDTGSALAGASITLTGYANYTQSSTGNGSFTFPAVYANQSYEYIISCPGYTSTTGIIDVAATAYQMGTITLNEIAYAPHSVVAALNSTYTAVNLQWEAPDPNAVEILESFENATFPPQDWSQIITNAGAANSMGVYPTFKRLGNIEIAGDTNATPTHGSYQTGLWWSYEHQDEWLLTPSFNCPPDAYLRFDSYVFLGSDNGDHYCVKASIDGGNSWQMLWDASAQTGGQSTYNAPFVVDLAPYGGQQITLAFQAEDPPSNDGLWYTWFIDNIYIGNTIAPVSFDGPALLPQRSVASSVMPAAEALTRDGRAGNNNKLKAYAPAKSDKRDDRVLVGYKIYRFVSGQEANEASWTLLNDEAITALTFADEGWEALVNSTYRWGVKAVYTADVSSPAALSNPLAKETVTGNIVGFVRKTGGQGIAGATVAAGSYTATTNAAGAY
ncbi:MAG: carboxypeptidase regulatory-like domain-containing protein, partial [Candidatus Cloacimonetes bacterium]|nr:carboxypeptidase regulatory-like domain-containing protein [Candidatus Cloacimonadota bacterium]MDY0172771.1 carboxypeptidase regulatory-like domain-containing protein [Candidatus Cloacimonadaceae bacterium]